METNGNDWADAVRKQHTVLHKLLPFHISDSIQYKHTKIYLKAIM